MKGNPRNKWVGFQETALIQLFEAFGNKFNIVIWTDETTESDYYCIPYSVVQHLFIKEHKTTGKYPNRWTAIILEHRFLMHSNTQLSVDISDYYAIPLITQASIDVEEDFYIENAKAEINIRMGQSKFRKGILKNFGNRCALTGITELELLTASHIIPWAHKKDYRGDISNGICLYIEYDALFDKGFISFTDDLTLIVASNISHFSNYLKEELQSISGRQVRQPLNKPLNKEYLRYRRTEIFKG